MSKTMNCSQILDGFLFLGGATAAKNLEALTQMGITHIVNCAGRNHFPDHFVYLKTHFRDSDVQLIPVAKQVFVFLDQVHREGGRVLVHCLAGISRSAAIVTAYLMYHDHLTLDEALLRVRRRRNVNPNKFFVDQLRDFENELKESDDIA